MSDAGRGDGSAAESRSYSCAGTKPLGAWIERLAAPLPHVRDQARSELRSAGDAAVPRLVQALGLSLTERVDASPRSALVFELDSFRATAERRVNATFDLPDRPIRSIRIEPTEFIGARVVLLQLALMEGGTVSPIEACEDARIQLVRTVKLERLEDSASCAFRFGSEGNTGWIAPTALRGLEPNGAARRLLISLSGELGMDVRIYLDLGQGYRSQDMLTVPVELAPEGVSD